MQWITREKQQFLGFFFATVAYKLNNLHLTRLPMTRSSVLGVIMCSEFYGSQTLPLMKKTLHLTKSTRQKRFLMSKQDKTSQSFE